jgi:aurora kinase
MLTRKTLWPTTLPTPPKQAPEVLRCPPKLFPEENKHRADLAYGCGADVFALGVLTFEMLCGAPPFRGSGPRDSSGVVFTSEVGSWLGWDPWVCVDPTNPTNPKPPLQLLQVSSDAREFVLACLAAQPSDRPSIEALAAHAWVSTTGNRADGERPGSIE